jgi:RHS repeat-associated protein
MAVDVATGSVSLSYTDFILPGAFPLEWKRRYSTQLMPSDGSPLGLGWTCPFFASLVRNPTEWVFTNPQGIPVHFPDMNDELDKGVTLRNLGAYFECYRKGIFIYVLGWDPESHEVVKYGFKMTQLGRKNPVAFIENLSGHGLEFSWDSQDRLKGVRQRLEGRTIVVDHSSEGTVARVSLLLPGGATRDLVRYSFDSNRNLIGVTDALGLSERFEYQPNGRLVRQLEKDGGIFSYKYDTQGRCIRTSGLDNYDLKTIRFVDSVGHSEVTDSYGNRTYYELNGMGQIRSELNPMGGRREFEYDDFGRTIKISDSLGRVKTFEYDSYGNRSKLTDAEGNTSTYRFNESHQAIAYIDAAGAIWKKTFDSANRIIETVDPSSSVWKFSYYPNGRLFEVKNPVGPKLLFTYQMNGDIASICDWDGFLWKYWLDEMGHVTRIQNPAGRVWTSVYNAMGRMTQIQDFSEKVYRFKYDGKGRRIETLDPSGKRFKRNLGPCGRVSSIENHRGIIKKYKWGTEPYRLLGMVNAAGEVYSFQYDKNGKKIFEKAFDGRETHYERNVFGDCLATGNSIHEMIRFELDKTSRIIKKTLPDGEELRFEYDPLGRISAARNSAHSVELVRDSVGNVILETQDDSKLEFGYDQDGTLLSLVINGEKNVEYSYSNGKFKFAELCGRHRIGFTKTGPTDPVYRELPGEMVLSHQLAADGKGILQSISIRQKPEMHREFRKNDEGYMKEISDSRYGELHFGYDVYGFLNQIELPDHSVVQVRRDGTGKNIEYVSEEGDVSRFSYDEHGRVIARGDTVFEFDVNGRMVSRWQASDPERKWNYRWDAMDQLVEISNPDGEAWRYSYDALGRRLTKAGPDGKSSFVWNKHVVAKVQTKSKPDVHWMYSPGGFIPLGRAEGTESYSIITDLNGTPTDMYSHSGDCVWSGRVGYFGGLENYRGNADKCELRMPGQWFDPESGLHYNRFRYYSPEIGKYISQDPIGLRGGLNPYEYGEDVYNWIDPFGLMKLFRGMKKDSEGKPVVYSGPNENGQNAANSLGVRPTDTDGMSTNTDLAEIQDHRKPKSFGGKNSDEASSMFVIDSDELAQHGLIADPDHDSHVSITTAPGEDPATLPEKLAATKEAWKPVTKEEAEKIMAEEAKKTSGCNG